MSKLKDKVAIVSGSGRGVGRAIALKLASEGASVVVNDLDEEQAATVAREITAMGGRVATCTGDVCAAGFAERFIDTAIGDFGGLHIIVNNAGYTWDSTIQKMTDEQFQAMLEVHAVAPFRVLRAASPFIKAAVKQEEERGIAIHRKVINISSTSALYGVAGQTAYSAGKAAIIGMTRTLAKEWGRYKVNVNCVAFGSIRTRLTEPLGDGGPKFARIGDREVRVGVNDELLAHINRLTPLGRQGEPEEAAGAVYLLSIPESDFITGHVLTASGGLTL